jgi:hypothetical protein
MSATLLILKPACVLLSGPHAGRNFDGDEVAEWHVKVGDHHGQPLVVPRNTRQFRDYGSAVLYAARLSRLGRLQLRDDAYPT